MKMLGRMYPDWCQHCHGRPGPDCPSRGKTKRQAKRRERAAWRREWLAAL